MVDKIRNVAIIAHVDHGKTTLVDKLLKQSGTLQRREAEVDLVMDSNDQERERGITILAKNTAIDWNGYRINIVDTPGHADFGGEVERALSMVDSVLLLVDAVDGPMPQTRFVTQKAFARGLRPVVVINKVDRPFARPYWVVDQVFDLFVHLGATDEQLDFPILYASALLGKAGMSPETLADDMTPLLEHIVTDLTPPKADPDGPFQMQVSALDYSSYVGVIGLGRINRGRVRTNDKVTVIDHAGARRPGRVLQVLGHLGLERFEVPEAAAGDIVCITGIENLYISDTICNPETPEQMPPLIVDEPTVSMTFHVNDSPFSGREGKYITSRNLKERLDRELLTNVALRVEDTGSPNRFKVSGRGTLHLSVLIETMRRENFELGVSRPEVIRKEINGVTMEPYERLTIEVEEQHQGSLMEEIGNRRGELQDMVPDHKGRVRLEYIVPSRGLIGFRSVFLTLTSGSGVMAHAFAHYDAVKKGDWGKRNNGVMISKVAGKTLAFSLENLQERGKLFLGPTVEVYPGMIVGIHARGNDLVVNPTKGKQLTNMRASTADEAIMLTPPLNYTLEQALEFIDDDELVEVTPKSVRMRKKLLNENDRKRSSKNEE